MLRSIAASPTARLSALRLTVSRADRDDPVVPSAGEPPLLEECARCEGLHDFAADEPLGELGIFHLLADGDAVPCGDELAEVVGRGLHRHAGQRDAVAARGERDVEDAGGEVSVLVEHLVEIADPVKQDGMRMLCLYLAPVLEHRRRRGSGLAAHGGHGSVREDGRGIPGRI